MTTGLFAFCLDDVEGLPNIPTVEYPYIACQIYQGISPILFTVSNRSLSADSTFENSFRLNHSLLATIFHDILNLMMGFPVLPADIPDSSYFSDVFRFLLISSLTNISGI